ncbi:hypothetical protein GUITHDRAFT_119487 [Guillardia theta CCMP2712]|uniref:Uncharacterized protein n=1 Tax=Guillardia theta (strain CCMP2712) TaxID=905079 RepID=L1IDM6_GUITC|nr:hypothetical protein GUITHDRAFT_119487 [Guillardia theta CCMP2712]EKX34318.1 hypothetical protein GUITHDRAFT_119487 [Guillardia theta CCMP2712]|eukprot:XP_005821298.1 hypothetical protein GUITHDRAFT_119487 [Guillardia theta CCMP2712]
MLGSMIAYKCKSGSYKTTKKQVHLHGFVAHQLTERKIDSSQRMAIAHSQCHGRISYFQTGSEVEESKTFSRSGLKGNGQKEGKVLINHCLVAPLFQNAV